MIASFATGRWFAVLALMGVAAGGLAAPGKKGVTLDSIRAKKPVAKRPAVKQSAIKKPAPSASRTARPAARPPAAVAGKPRLKPAALMGTAASVSSAMVKPPRNTLANGRVAWWPMEGNARDIVGGNHGELRRGVSAVAGPVGVALQFDGNRSGITVPDSVALQLADSFTISLWLTVQAFPPHGGQSQIFFRGDGRGGLDPYSIYLSSARRLGFVIDSGSAGSGSAPRLEVPLAERTPVHVSAMFDASAQMMRLYLDGKLTTETKTLVRPLRDLDPKSHPGVGIGNTQFPGEHEQPLFGIIDDLQVHNRALTGEELALLARR